MVDRLKNGCILPCRHSQGKKLDVYSFEGGVTDAEGRFVESSLLHERPCDVGGCYEAKMKIEPTTAIFVGYLLNEWGNCLVDGLKKLWFLHTVEGKKLLANGAIVAFITMNNQPLPSHQRELWRLAGFDSSKWILVKEPTRFDEVIVPENSLITYPDETRLFDERFIDVIQTIKNQAIKEANTKALERIYFTRTNLKVKKDYNEQQIEKLFKRLGYEIVSPEKLSIVNQIFLWSTSKHIATTEGSISHSSMFMSSNSNIVILRKANYVNGYQQAADKLSGAKVTYINANHSTCTSKAMPWAGPFYLYITPELEQWSGIKVYQLPIFLKPSYWRYCILAYLRTIKLWFYCLIIHR